MTVFSKLSESDEATFNRFEDMLGYDKAMLCFTHGYYTPEKAAKEMPEFHAKYFPEKCHVGDYWYYAMRTEWNNTHRRMKNTILKHPASKYVLDNYKPTGAGDLPSILKNVSLSNVTSTDNVSGSVSQTSSEQSRAFCFF